MKEFSRLPTANSPSSARPAGEWVGHHLVPPNIFRSGKRTSFPGTANVTARGRTRLSSSSETVASILSIQGRVLWPYFAGAAVLSIGLAAVAWQDVGRARGLEKLVPFGPVMFAVSMAVFSGDHFAFAKGVSTIVPRWMPWHLFWTYFVGTALIAAALSIAARKESQLAAAMLGIMLFLFVLMVQIPACIATPHDKTRYTIFLRDLALSAGVFSYAASQAADWRRGAYRGLGLGIGSDLWQKAVPVMRVVIGIVITEYGVQHFLFPNFAPGIPQEGTGVLVTMPSWIPAHTLWAYLTGAVFVVCGVSIIVNRRARLAATVLGATAAVLIVCQYVPQTIQNASNIGLGLNYLAIHFALAGDALLLAGALPKSGATEGAVEAEVLAGEHAHEF
jgi:uncharacterized membrane protein